MKKILSEIKIHSTHFSEKSEEELGLIIEQVKRRFKGESLNKLIPEWFALVQEMSFRKIGLKHFDTQLQAGIFLHEGKIIEMKTGEGKTLASTLAITLNALSNQGVHVVTVNDYLAERDQKWMGKIYQELGLTVGLVKSTSNLNKKKESYNADITYLTNSELVFDYLRDSSVYNLNEIVQRPLNYCIIDEIDSILIDEARTPLILSTSKGEKDIKKLCMAKIVANDLEKESDFEVDEKRRDINLTEKGYKKVMEKVGKKTLFDSEDPWILQILNALKAIHFFKLNKDYILLNQKIQIVDEVTGRVMPDRRWNMGIHQAIETKENVTVGDETKTKTSMTYQNFFILYPKLAGMTGTGKTVEQEFQEIYNLKVVVLNTVKPMVRKDLSDLVYQTEFAKWTAVLKQSKECFQKGQPILIGTACLAKSEFLSELFKSSEIPHRILNAKPENVAKENEIIAQAGEPYAITIATNMAGRGTDIILGGNPAFKVKQMFSFIFFDKNKSLEIELFKPFIFQILKDYQTIKNPIKKEQKLENLSSWFDERTIPTNLKNDIINLPYSVDNACQSFKEFYTYLYQDIFYKWKEENAIVKELGGLFVLGTERHQNRRIDNQLRGRAGRQGDPGISQFVVSLEDDLIKTFGGDNIGRWIQYLLPDKNVPLESTLLTQSLEDAQKKVELYNYEIRKNVFQYDDILNRQRKQLFQARNEILTKNIWNELFLIFAESKFDEEVENKKSQFNNNKLGTLHLEKENRVDLKNMLKKRFNSHSTYFSKAKLLKQIKQEINRPSKNTCNEKFYKEIWISQDLRLASSNFYQLGFLQKTQRQFQLKIIDEEWSFHLERINFIRETINWRSYGQQNPLIEYNIEVTKSFKVMLKQIRECMLYYFLENPLIE